MEGALKENVMAMHNACSRGDLDEILRLLKEGVDVNARDKDLNTPLLTCMKSAVLKKKLPTVTLLVENGALLDIFDKNFLTPVLASVIYVTDSDEIMSIVEYLLNQNADASICNNNNQNVLHVATMHLNADVYHQLVVLLVKHKYTELLFAENKFNVTPLFEATRIPLLDVTIEIFAKHWNLCKNEPNVVASGILNQAVKNLRSGDFLVKLGKVFAGCNSLKTCQAVLMETALQSGNSSVITLLKPNVGDPTGKSRIESASGEESKRNKSLATNWTEEMALAVAGGDSATKLANVVKLEERFMRESRFGNTLLHAAAYFDNIEVAQLLLENGRDVNLVGGYGFTPIMSGLEKNDAPRLDMVKLLVKYGARVHSCDAKKSAIARCAMRKGPDWIEVFNYLYGIWKMNKGEEEDPEVLAREILGNDQESYATLSRKMVQIGQWPDTKHK